MAGICVSATYPLSLSRWDSSTKRVCRVPGGLSDRIGAPLVTPDCLVLSSQDHHMLCLTGQ